ncbi:MAG: PQQ-dependent sugar dehydrogenase, partial [Bacteroidota bacterium]
MARFRQLTSYRLDNVHFEKVELGEEVKGKFTSILIGPDKKLYASTIQGQIKRFEILENGKLELLHTIKPFGDKDKVLIGMAFRPLNNQELELWVSYANYPELRNAPTWDSKIARLTLDPVSPKVKENKVIVKHLPRSAKDHLTNGINFGPDGALYISQGSNSSMGKATQSPDWDYREESLLSAAVLRLDINKLPSKLPVDVKTVDGDGTYNFASQNAPLSLYATGVRNAYDLVWHSNGNLYLPVNGSMKKQSTPTSDPKDPNYIAPIAPFKNDGRKDIPGLDLVGPAQNDRLFRIEQGGYYGHPNPLRGEFILNEGDKDVDDPAYDNVKPDDNYRYPVYDFGKHASPNGIVEYQSSALNGRLQGMLVVARFNVYYDLMFIKLDEQDPDKVLAAYDGSLIGMGGMDHPLDLTEDPHTGNIYVSEFGGEGKISLYRPSLEQAPQLAQSQVQPEKKLPANSLKGMPNNESADLEVGEKVFNQYCVACHGGEGEGGNGPSFQDNVWIYGGNTYPYVFNLIKNGGKNGMQAWEDRLTPEEIRDVSV